MRRIAALLFVFSLVCCSTRPMLAQEGSATLTGFIQDSSKAVIPGVKVTAIATNTNQRFKATTSKDGSYTIVSLPVGPYQVEVEKVGFKTILKDDLFLHTQDALEINFQMAVGSTLETITVNSATTNDNPAVSMTVDREFIENMPLNGGSFQDLIQLAPGAVSDAGYYSVNGQRQDSNNFTVDGMSANLGGLNNTSGSSIGAGLSGSSPAQTALGTTQSLASIDALQEFVIQTSGYTAEYGRNPGGQVQLTTRSGTNDIHGSLFEYLRNTAFDANSFSNDYYGDKKTAEHQNDFGGTVSGPVVVPRLYNGKDKTFYFFSYEGLRLLLPDSETEYVPTQALRSWASPQIQPVLNAAPLPNGPNNSDGCTIPGTTTPCDALFHYGYSYPVQLDNIGNRIDQNLGSRLHAFLRYAYTPSSEVTGAEQTYSQIINTQSWTAGLTATITRNLVDDFRFNSSSDKERGNEGQQSVDGSIPVPRGTVIPPQYDNPSAFGTFAVYVPGTSLRVEPKISSTRSNLRQYQVTDSISWVRNQHTLKFGMDWRRIASTYSIETYRSSLATAGLADIQNGYATTAQISASNPGAPVFDNLSLYAQDHWKISSRLSIDYGLRWEFNPPPGPSNGAYPAVLTSGDLATATIAPLGTPPYKTSYNHFAPRFGFAWNAIPSASHALTVRGGFGIFCDTGQQAIGNAYAGDYPFTATGPTLKEVPLPLSAAQSAPPSLNFPIVAPYSDYIFPADPDLTLPYTEQWNLSVDYGLNTHNTLTTSYVGNNGRKLLITQQYESLPNPDFPDGLRYTYNGSQSSYNALQVQDVGRIAKGLDLVASFTWAHALDNASDDESDFAPQWGNSQFDIRRMLNLALNYQTPTASWSHWMESVTHGWLLANRFSIQSGYPLDVFQDSFVTLPNGEEANGYFPDLVPGVPIYLHGRAADVDGKPVPASWRLNRAAFACVPTNTGEECSGTPLRQGTLGRLYIRNPSFWALNTSLQRNFPLYERLHLNFRVDAFNIFNHPSLSGPDTGLTDSTFGQLSSETSELGAGGGINSGGLYSMGAARSLQFSLHLQF